MELTQDPVAAIPELLELILECLLERKVLVIKRASKSWRNIINKSLNIQEALFIRSNADCLTGDNYMIDPIPLFLNANFAYGLSYPFIANTTSFTLNEGSRHSGDSPHLDAEMYRHWIAENGSLRRLQVAQPSITEIHWYVIRDCQDAHGSLYRVLPQVIAKFKFSGGLQVGDYYDLIAGNRGRFAIRWPGIGGGPAPVDRGALGVNQNLAYDWYQKQAHIADTHGAILVYQEVEKYTYKQRRGGHLYRPDLQRYHNNLQSVKTLKVTKDGPGGPSVTLYESTSDTYSAMQRFLHAAQDPI
ncbi:hypothetical protein GGS26DRAFT_596687 [Hypomontagnella submonticulosa]|nr:hypothetical protein GGS26DRAFT_596687 [Hypomontagnella submonticulosa]